MNYFSLNKASNCVWRIRDPFGCFCTLIVGSKRALLVDSGIGFGNTANAVSQITDLTVSVLNTHEHLDHSMGGRFFEQCFMHEKCRDYLSIRNGTEFRQRVLDLYMPGGAVPGFDPDDFFAYDYSNICYIQGDESIDLGGIMASVVPLPSHTPGSVGVLLHELRLLLTGDSIAPLTSLMFEESLTPVQHSRVLKTVKQLDFDYMLCGHSERAMPKAYLDVFLRFIEKPETATAYRYRDSIYRNIQAKTVIYHDDRSDEAAAFILRKDQEVSDT